jgi:dihydroflavonol-4-reductase
MKTYLVTGGTGFLGQHLVRQLLDTPDTQVRILSRSKDRALEKAGAQFVRGSVFNPSNVREAVQGIDGVFHLAGKVEREPRRAHTLFTLHVTGTRNVLEIAAEEGVSRAVVASTSGTVGVTQNGRTIPNDDAPHASEFVKDWPYYLSKVYAEKTALSLEERVEMDIILMRPTLLLGPGDHRLSSTKDVLNFIDGNIPFVPSGGLSFVDVRDTAAAFIKAMDQGKSGATYLLGGANLTFEAFFERLESISGVSRPRMAVPDPAARVGAKLMDVAMKLMGKSPDIDPISVEMSQHFWYIDWSAAMRDLEFEPRDPGQTLYDTIQWLKSNRPSTDGGRSPSTQTVSEDFTPNSKWEGDWRHAAYSKSAEDAYGETLHEPSSSIPYPGQSRLSYDTLGGEGPGLESLLSGALKSAVGAVIKARDTHSPSPSPAPSPRAGGPSKKHDDNDASRVELDGLLHEASPEELETILRLVRRMKR